VYRLRLARDLIVQETLLAEVWRMGREVFSTSGAEAGYLKDREEPGQGEGDNGCEDDAQRRWVRDEGEGPPARVASK
jgi:hypothetical protein